MPSGVRCWSVPFRQRKSGHYGKTNSQPKPMPLYEYVCRTCGEKIAEVLTIKEHDTKKVQCPKCQSTELEKIIEPFFAKTARKS